jgi:hypothetical protein
VTHAAEDMEWEAKSKMKKHKSFSEFISTLPSFKPKQTDASAKFDKVPTVSMTRHLLLFAVGLLAAIRLRQ